MAMFVQLIAQLVNFIMKLLKNVFVQAGNSGMEIFVSIVMVDKHGTQLWILVPAQQEAFGTDIHVSILAQVEEFLILQVDNVYVLQETGMEEPV